MKFTKSNLFKKCTTTLIAGITCLSMIGCSSNNEKEEQISEQPTINEEVKQDTEKIEEVKVDTPKQDTAKDVQDDKIVLSKLGELTMNFISEGCTKISTLATQGDVIGVVGYANGVTNADSLPEIRGNFDKIYLNMKTDLGRENCMKLKNLFEDYIVILDRLSANQFDDYTIELINKITENIPSVTQDILGM